MKQKPKTSNPNGPTEAEHAAFRSLHEGLCDLVDERRAAGFLFPLPPTNAEIDVLFRSIAVFDGIDGRRSTDNPKGNGGHK